MRTTWINNPLNAGGGSEAAVGVIACELAKSWSRRAQHSISAGFCAATKSSVMEIAGNRIRITTANATNCARPPETLRGSMRSHAQTNHAATNAQLILRMSSIPGANSTSVKNYGPKVSHSTR